MVGAGQDRGGSKVLPVRVQRQGGGGENRIHSGEEQGAGGAVPAPSQRAPTGLEPPGNAMRTATKPATGEGIPTGGAAGSGWGRDGGGYSLALPMMARM